jgi:hypothetical protein
MSGGSLDYVYGKIEEASWKMSARAVTPLHRAFARHLMKVAQAAHDLEWVLSGDTSEGSEIAAIEACIGPHAELEQLIAEAKAARNALDAALARIEVKLD